MLQKLMSLYKTHEISTRNLNRNRPRNSLRRVIGVQFNVGTGFIPASYSFVSLHKLLPQMPSVMHGNETTQDQPHP